MLNRYFFSIASLVILVTFLYFLFFHSLSVPSFDDYDATLRYIRKIYSNDLTLSEKFISLFRRHNEHRILPSRVLALLYFYFFNKLNFSHLVIIQNIFLLGCIILTIKLLRRSKFPIEFTYLICATFLLNFSFYQVSFFYWGGIQHYTVVFFCIISIVFLDKSRAVLSFNYLFSLIAAFLAAFSFGNGFLCLLLGSFLLFSQRKYVLLLPWSILSVVLIYVQFFVKTNPNTPTHGPINFDWVARLLFTFSGSFLFVNPPGLFLRYSNIIICAAAGALVIAYWAYLFFSGFARKKPLLYALLSLPILTGIIISISRFDTKSAGGVAPRYMFFTAWIPLAILLILWDQKVLTKKHLTSISAAALILWSVSFYNNRNEFLDTNHDITQRIQLWKNDKNQPLIYYMPATHHSELMEWAVSNRIVEPDSNTVDNR